MKKISSIIVILALVICMSLSINAATGKGGDNGKYYMVTFASGHPYWVGCLKGFQAAAKQYGVKVYYGGAQEYDINKAVTAFEQIAAQKPTGIALTCMNPEPFVNAINKAMANGVPVVCFDTDSPNSKRLTYCSTDNVTAGYMVGQKVIKMIGGKGEVAALGRPGQLNIDQRVVGFKKALAEAPNVKLVAYGDGAGEIGKSTAAAASIIQGNPNIKVIFAADTISAPGAAAACEETKRNDIKVYGFDTTDDILSYVKSGKIYTTVAQNTYNMGYWSMVMLYTYVHHLDNPFTAWKNEGTSPLPTFVDTGIDFVTKNNADLFGIKK